MRTIINYSNWKSIFWFSVFMLASIHTFAQHSSEKLCNMLVAARFENVRVVETDSAIFVSVEDNLFRWNIDGVNSALGIIASQRINKQVRLVMLKREIPQIVIAVTGWKDSRPNIDGTAPMPDGVEVSYTTANSWEVLKPVAPSNPPENKIDLVIYPQFGLQNTLFTQIYEVQLNLAPAIEISLWRGMQFTGQVIFPIVNQLGYEGDFIRPGFVTLSQEFRLPHQWFGRATIGNFNANRYGADICIDHPFANNHWSAGFNAGLTGSSHFYDGQWVTGGLNTLTWFVKAGYYYPVFNLQFDLSYGCYLNKDYGFRADCTRHFGETTVGFYAQYTGGKPNGGFHFSIPLPPYKRNRQHVLRLAPPGYFDWEYNAGTEFYYGRYYETRPNENRSERWYNPLYIKNEILKLITK